MKRILFFIVSGFRFIRLQAHIRAKQVSRIILLMLCPFVLRAQNDGNVSMYWAVPTLYNPSMVGCDSALHVSVFDRMQWVGVDGAPQTFFLSGDMPFQIKGKRQGVGLTLLNDKAGLFSTTILGAQYAYSKKVKGGRLALGFQAGVISQDFKGGEIYIPDGDAWEPNDELLPRGDVSGTSVDLGIGVFYEKNIEGNTVYGGLSAMHLNEATIDLEEYSYSEQKRTYYFLAGGNIPVRNTLYILQPSVLVKTTAQATQFEATFRATYDHRFWGGVSYRNKDAVVLMIGADIDSFRIGYSYDIGTSALAKASNGSHEIMMTYNVKVDIGKKKRRPSKSIRIL